MNTTNRIPFLDLVAPHEELKEELVAVFETVLQTGGFIGGPMVDAFERDFASFCDSPHCVGVASGTDALRFALIAAGINPGDITITVPNTFIATAEAISQAGARPAFVDIDERTHNMDPEKVREYLEIECAIDDRGRPIHKASGRPVTAIVPVHLYGQMCDMDSILELAGLYHLTVIEDACQAHGAQYFSRKEDRWLKAGSMGLAAAFSFYPGKNLGACGEAGAVTTGDATLAQTVRMLRDHGQAKKYYHDMEGYNGRLDAIQAGVLSVKLGYLSAGNEKRREAARRYQELLGASDKDLRLPWEPSWSRPVYHLYVIRVQNRDELIKHLASRGIGTGIHYPVPLHLQKAYQNLGYIEGGLSASEKAASQILSLPMYPQLRPNQQEKVAGAIAEFVEGKLATAALAS